MKQKTLFILVLLIFIVSIVLIIGLNEKVLKPIVDDSSRPLDSIITTPTPPTPIKLTGTITFNNYKITLPKGYWAEPIEVGYEAEVPNTFCYPGRKQDKPGEKICHTLKIHNDNYQDLIFEISDVQNTWEKWGEHGGFITTVKETESLNNNKDSSSFNFEYRGIMEDLANGQGLRKQLSENGQPMIYWIFGCLKDRLCISFDESGMDTYKTGTNYITDSFRNFVKNLTIQE